MVFTKKLARLCPAAITVELTEGSGYLTPKLSIKRDVIMRDFAATIQGMYQGVPVVTEQNPVVRRPLCCP